MPTYRDPGMVAFTAAIATDDEHAKMGGYWINYPHDASEQFGVKGRIPVKATFDGIPYAGSLCKMGEGPHMLLIRKEIRLKLKKAAGDKVKITIRLDAGERTVDVPSELTEALKTAGLADKYAAMSFTCRKEYAAWIAGAKKPETRARRLEKAVAMIKQGKKFS